MRRRRRGDNGLLQGFPPNTGVGWDTLATGTWPGEHGSTNNTFHRAGEATSTTAPSFATTGILQADTIQQAAERAGKTVVSVEWVGARGLVPAAAGPGRRLPHASSRAAASCSTTTCRASRRGANASASPTSGSISTRRRAGRTCRPRSARRSRSSSRSPTRRSPRDNVDRSTTSTSTTRPTTAATNYDRVLRRAVRRRGKDGAAAVADLRAGEWADVKVTLTGARAGQTAGFYVKAIEIAPDLSKFRLYFTSLARANATYNALGAAGLGGVRGDAGRATSRPRPPATSRRSRPGSSTRTPTSSRA